MWGCHKCQQTFFVFEKKKKKTEMDHFYFHPPISYKLIIFYPTSFQFILLYTSYYIVFIKIISIFSFHLQKMMIFFVDIRITIIIFPFHHLIFISFKTIKDTKKNCKSNKQQQQKSISTFKVSELCVYDLCLSLAYDISFS